VSRVCARLLPLLLLLCAGPGVRAQSIKGRYVSRAQEDGTVYHTFPETLFEHPEAGDLTFDITYKSHCDGRATINFTYEMARMTPVDSVRFVSGDAVLAGPAEKIYVEPEKKRWKHRYGFRTDAAPLHRFFDERQTPEVWLYAGGEAYRFRVKRSAWRSYAPVGFRIFEMIRANER